MLDHDDLWLLEELPLEEPSELLQTMPEIKQYVGADPDDEAGLRSILNRPEALTKAWWRHANTRKRRVKNAKRHAGVSRVLRAA